MVRKRVASVVAVAAIGVVALLFASTSEANGPCGQDFDGNHACAVNSPGTYDGSLITDNERDYYVFHARKGTELSVSITDTENPSCTSAGYPIECGDVGVGLYNAEGNSEGENAWSQPNNGITVPGTFSHTLEAGTYYLLVSGGLGQDNNGNPASIPYSLAVSATPNVQWPPPAPPPTHTIERCSTKHIWRRRHHRWVRVRKRMCHAVVVSG